MRIRGKAVMALALVGSLLLGACGGDDDDPEASGRRRERRHAVDRRLRRARRRPTRPSPPSGTTTDEGEGVRVHRRPTAPPATRAARSRPGSRPTTCTSRSPATSPAWSTPAWSADTWDAGPTKGVVSSSVVVFAVREGNPKNIQDLGRPHEAGRRRSSRRTRRRPAPARLERPRRLRPGHRRQRRAPTRRPRSTSRQFFANVVRPAGQRPRRHHPLPRRHRRRRCWPTRTRRSSATQNGEEFDCVIPDDHHPHREPGRGADRRRPEGAGVPGLRAQRRTASAQFALKGFRPIIDGVDTSEDRGRQRPVRPVPGAVKAPAHRRRTTSSSWKRTVGQVLRRGGRHHHQGDRRVGQGLDVTRRVFPWVGRRCCDRSVAGRLTAPGSGLGVGDALVQPAGAHPAGGRRRPPPPTGGWAQALVRPSPTSRPPPPSGSPSAPRWRSPRSTS